MTPMLMDPEASLSEWALDASDSVTSVDLANSSILGDTAADDANKNPPPKPSKRNRRIVLASISLAALLFGLATYLVVDASQRAEFESNFASYARETADIAESNAEDSFGQLKSLATAITSLVVDRQDKQHGGDDIEIIQPNLWPFVSVPHFDLRTQQIAEFTGIEMICFVPFVTKEDKAAWERYQRHNQEWILQDYHYRGWDATHLAPVNSHIYNYTLPPNYNDTRRGFVDKDNFMEDILQNMSYPSEDFSAPIAQYGPGMMDTDLAMLDLFTHPIFKKEMVASLEYDVPVISETEDLEFLLKHIVDPSSNNNTNNRSSDYHDTRDYSLLRSFTLDQVREDFREDSRTIGYLVAVIPWQAFFRNLLPPSVNGIVVKVVSDCGSNFTYVCNGGKDDWEQVGNADQHQDDDRYYHMKQHYQFFWKDHPQGVSRHCHFDLVVFPNQDFADLYLDPGQALVYAVIVVAVCCFVAVAFLVYDVYQQSKQTQVIEEKARIESIVTSLFPAHFGERIMAEFAVKNTKANDDDEEESNELQKQQQRRNSKTQCISDFLSGGGGVKVKGKRVKTKPLADLFTSATICFADIQGFTAWSSAREPFQVFTLLETLYQAFDKIAKTHGVFKVETIGDCYVACSGVPKANERHAVAVASFAHECLNKFHKLVRRLELDLGPDTADLALRTGLHSGPVTAGVLRGERARFQLFGDTMNTCSRIESSGEGGSIHISQETADELVKQGKESWFVPRKDKVSAKGKGMLTTFWLRKEQDETATTISNESCVSEYDMNMSFVDLDRRPMKAATKTKSLPSMLATEHNEDKKKRLIMWMAVALERLLQAVVAQRKAKGESIDEELDEKAIDAKLRSRQPVEEVAEIINLPTYDQAGAQASGNKMPEELNRIVVKQIRGYVKAIAQLYPENEFHNFDHASHVALSATKLLSRIVAPKVAKDETEKDELHRKIHDHTYGITSDPITQFACVFSALIHDCDHEGVPNAQLVKEGTELAAKYHAVSVAEQNSVDVAWDILMEFRFKELRKAIYTTEAEMIRFRQLVVNSVMATDITDKDLKELRNARWARAFKKDEGSEQEPYEESETEAINRKATIVIEHLIQASDVSHTMQHWHVFLKWNERLFREMYAAYKAGRSEKDPSEFWYRGEIGFFDFYIIPLAKKLKECGVFGVSSDEYLNYAQSNRREWEVKGEDIVRGYLAACEKEHDKGTRFGLYSIASQYAIDGEMDSSSERRAALRKAKSVRRLGFGDMDHSSELRYPSLRRVSSEAGEVDLSKQGSGRGVRRGSLW